MCLSMVGGVAEAPIFSLFRPSEQPEEEEPGVNTETFQEPLASCFTSPKQVRSQVRPHVPVPSMKDINSNISRHVASFEEKFNARLEELSSRVTVVTGEVQPFLRVLPQLTEQVQQIANDVVSVSVNGLGKHRKIISELAVQADQSRVAQNALQGLIEDLGQKEEASRRQVAEFESEIGAFKSMMAQTTSSLDALRRSVEARARDRNASVDRINSLQDSLDHLQRAISHDLELVAAGKVTEFKDLAVVRATKVSPMVHLPRSPRQQSGLTLNNIDEFAGGAVAIKTKRGIFETGASRDSDTSHQTRGSLASWESSVAPSKCPEEHVKDCPDATGTEGVAADLRQNGVVKRSTRWLLQQRMVAGLVHKFTSETDMSFAVAAESANCYTLKESVWDASLFFAFPQLRVVTHVFLFVALFANFFLQGLFCIFVVFLPHIGENYTPEAIEQFELWYARSTDVIRDRVCDQDRSLTTSYAQLEIYGEAVSYTTQVFGWFGFEQGSSLCGIVLFTWFLSMCNVIQNICAFLTSVWLIHSPESEVMQLEKILKNNKSLRIANVPTRRLVFVAFGGILQMVIAVTLMIYGALWLACSTKATDLFSNTLALTYIMDIDCLVFQAIVPREVHYIVRNIDALSLRRSNREERKVHVPWRSMLTVSGLALIFFLFFFLVLAPLSEAVRVVKRTICPFD